MRYVAMVLACFCVITIITSPIMWMNGTNSSVTGNPMTFAHMLTNEIENCLFLAILYFDCFDWGINKKCI